MAVSFSSSLLDSPYIVVTGATYDIEMINAVQWLLDEGRIAEGDTVGHIYLEGDYGENALAGAEYAADELGVEIVDAEGPAHRRRPHRAGHRARRRRRQRGAADHHARPRPLRPSPWPRPTGST